MAKYVDSEVIKEKLSRTLCLYEDLPALIDSIPAADVRPVVRGKWEVSRTDYAWNGAEYPTHCKCSECGREVRYLDTDNYCPNCGAKMEES